ncbi:MAG: hypothetical protein ABIN01_07390 [Ferruginibacter sp.]
MKKSLALFAIAALLSSASFAQYNHRRNNNYDRDMAVNNNRERNGYGSDKGTYYFSAKEKNMQIAAINKQYYRSIESVRKKMFMSRSKKERMIYSLEMQRDAEIRSVYAKFNDRRNRGDERDDRYNDYDKRSKW